jgi:hypothetical protein
MIDYGILFILLSSFSGLFIKGNLRRGYIVSIVFGIIMVIKLLGYIVVVNLIKIYLAPFNGFVDFPEVDILKYVLLGIAVAEFGFLHWIRKISVKKLQAVDLKREQIVARLVILSLIIYAICESIVIYGLVLFLMAGSTLSFYFFLLLGLLCLGIYFPRYGQWEKWAKLQEHEKPAPIGRREIGFIVLFALVVITSVVVMNVFTDNRIPDKLKAVVKAAKKEEIDKTISLATEVIEEKDLRVDHIANAYFLRGTALSDKGEFDHAIADFTKAIELNPSHAAVYTNRGIAYEKKGKHDKAISDFTKAIELNPRLAEAYSNRGFVYMMTWNKNKACSDWKQACELGDCRNYEAAKRKGDC